MARVYFHIDLNAFFASAEVLRDPSLRNLPIAVSGHTRRSVVSTASYEARVYGVHSAMPISEAKQLCPELLIVEPHFIWYRSLSEKFIEIVARYCDELEQASIDECYAEVTEKIKQYKRPLDLAWELQRAVKAELGLSCSIGVAPNMFLAKMASDMKKPMGITVLRIREVQTKLWPLPIGDMRGIGNKTVPLLKAIGIHTIGDLVTTKRDSELKNILKKNYDSIIRRANGYDDRTIIRDWDSKSMGVSETLNEDVTDYEEIRGLFRMLSRKLSKRLFNNRKIGTHISIRIKYYDFQNVDRASQMIRPSWKGEDLFVEAMALFEENWNGNPIRLLGLSVTDFLSENGQSQINLFDESVAQREETVIVIDDLNRILGKNVLKRASQVKSDHEN